MPSDVSLCVIRIESCEKDDKPLEEGRGKKVNRTLAVFRGKRRKCDISVETLHLREMSETSEKVDGKDVIPFVSGNPFVEKTTGIIHLFKEDDLTGIDRAANRSQTVCILAVPTTMTCTDLLCFMAPCREDIKHVRIIKDGSPNQYMALITFRTPESVAEFYKNFNGIPFSMMQPEWCCHLVFVSKVETLQEEDGASVAPVNHTELPTCPVCLERMDESVDGILTIMCNHAFHGQCLSKWGDTTCPVCRYIQTPEPDEDSFCLECKATESLWICLICGHVGCGRYVQGHAHQHYTETHHCYSMQLGSNSVWDYVGDNFVHRILQNKADGKLVEGQDPEKSAQNEAKLEAIQLEYTYLLTSQLESQRAYYEQLISILERETISEITDLREKYDAVLKDQNELKERLNTLIKEKNAIEKKLQATTAKLVTTAKKLEEEKEMNASMRENQGVWQEKCKDLQRDLIKQKIEKEEEIRDLREQLRDLMFFLEAQKTVDSSPHKDEMKEGKIEVGPSPGPSPSTSKKPSKGRKSH